MLANVLSSFRIVPGRYARIVATKNVFNKGPTGAASQVALVANNVSHKRQEIGVAR